MKGLSFVFSLGSLICEFQIFYILLSVGVFIVSSKKILGRARYNTLNFLDVQVRAQMFGQQFVALISGLRSKSC